MFVHRKRNEFLTKEFVWFWIGLAFQAGFVNAAGFLAFARFVSHMTGFGTQVGVSLSESDYVMAVEMISAPASFLLGAMTSAFFVDRPMVYGKQPRYLLVMFAIVTIYIGVTAAGMAGWFGPFGEQLIYSRDFLLMSVLCFVCGLQNACFGSLTRGQIRTTHLTGILTDIGVAFVRLFHLHPKGRESTVLRRLNSVRILTFFSFSLGSAVSAVLSTRMGYSSFGFLVGTSTVLYVAMAISTHNRKKRREFAAAQIAAARNKSAARI